MSRQAVILSGGGANGAFEVGVMKALFKGRCTSTNHQPLDAHIRSPLTPVANLAQDGVYFTGN